MLFFKFVKIKILNGLYVLLLLLGNRDSSLKHGRFLEEEYWGTSPMSFI